MKISVVIANRTVIDPTINPENLKAIGETWGSWHQWHQSHPQNVLCHSVEQATKFVENNFHTACKLWTHERAFGGKRPDVYTYGGDFVHEIPDPEEIVALHLATSLSDIVVLVGFDWETLHTTDSVQLHQRMVRDDLIQKIVEQRPSVQWVITSDVPESLNKLPNVMSDTLQNILTTGE